ncbi:hypothetical protein [Streptomyces sp. NPDC014006]|uniref:hypothetical protein n=1 Tax=Streptomyces sp. NPDC014006 TaxID=3364870 RepID=UPI0036FF03C5
MVQATLKAACGAITAPAAPDRTGDEMKHTRKWPGATEAVGPGSAGDATMVVGGSLMNKPMDDWGTVPVERKLADAVVIVPKS